MATEMTWMQWKDQGSEHFRNKKWAEAANCYTIAIKLKSDEAILYSNRAICETKLKKFQQAREDARSALRIDPKNVKFYRILSESLMGLQLFKEALKVCEKGLKLDPKEPSLLSRLKECRSKLSGQGKKTESRGKDRWRSGFCKSNVPTPDSNDIEEFHPLAMLTDGVFVAGGDLRLRMPIRQPDIALQMFKTAEKNGSIPALYYIGMMHFRGQEGLKKDPIKAVTLWRRVAAEKPWLRVDGLLQPNLCVALAECAIGDAFRHGIGVKQDDNEAYDWYKRSAEHGNGEAIVNIASFAMTGRGGHLEPLSARIWIRKLVRSIYAEKEADIKEDYSDDETAIHFNVFAKLSLFDSPIKFKKELHNTEVLAQMMEKRLQGWPTAKSFFQAYDAMNEARDLVVEKKYHESFQKLREIWRTWDFALEDYRPFLQAARQLLEKDPDDHSALYIVAVCAPVDDFKDKLTLILICLQLDPSVPDYHLMAAHLYTMNEDFEIALKFCNKALELLPHPSWLFTRAHLLQLVGPKKFSVKKMIEAFQLYLGSVPSDYSDVAEAYYSVAWLLSYDEDGEDKETEETKTVYKMGRAAEEYRLPCFKDVEDYLADTSMERNLMFEHFDNVMAGRDTPLTIVQVMCSCCTKTENLFTCKTCKKTHYCSEKCHNNNKIVHKISCKK